MKFYTGALYEARTVAERILRLPISKIEIGERLCAVDEENVARLTRAYRRGDVLPPIRVRLMPDPKRAMAEWSFRLIYGHSRLLAAKAAGLTTIDVEIVTCTDAEARRMEASENLNRRTLNADQRMHSIAAILQSRLDEEQSVPLGPKALAGHRGESGLSKAARDEGISETAAKRAMHIAAIARAAKALYRAELPDITRSDLEVIARAPSERQVEVTQRIIDDRKAGRPSAVNAATSMPQLLSRLGGRYQWRRKPRLRGSVPGLKATRFATPPMIRATMIRLPTGPMIRATMMGLASASPRTLVLLGA